MNAAAGIPVVGGFFDNSDEEALDQLKKNQALYAGIDLPSLKDYNPESLQYQGDLKPQDVNYQTVQDDPILKNRQMDVLGRMSGLADTGLSAVDSLGMEDANQLGAKQARASTEAAINNARSRGVAGSGMEFAMREMGNQEGAGRARQAAMEAQAQAAQQRALYNTAYGNQLTAQRSQDFSNNAKNSDIINQFNTLNTGNKNTAQQRNLDARQTLNNSNATERNSAQQYNNTIREQGFQNAMSRANGMAGANTGMAQGYAAQNAANTAERGANTALAVNGAMAAAGVPAKKPAAS